jgi:hypothetical protein
MFNKDLVVVQIPGIAAPTRETQAIKMLKAVDSQKNYLPGQPRIRLDEPWDGKDTVLAYLAESHSTRKLDELLPFHRLYPWHPGGNIMPLHHQASHQREIKVTECPGLHLVWYHELIYIKPIPAYFYSPAFWEYLENADEGNKSLYKACVGFMRSYYLLIKYEIDFEEACKLRLIPKKDNGDMPTYAEWCRFILPFSRVGNEHVSFRYRFGELRLTRLNRVVFMTSLWARNYFTVYTQFDLHRNLGPIITILVVPSIILAAMQVVLAAVPLRQTLQDGPWLGFVNTSIWFPVFLMACIAYVLCSLIIGFTGVYLNALPFMRSNEKRKEMEAQLTDPQAGSRPTLW